MKHRIQTIRYEYTILCAACGLTWVEYGEDELTHLYPNGIDEGEWLECPHCKAEMECYVQGLG